MSNNETASFETTPMMKQYLSVKQQYPQDLLFFRMGDFFELFFEDAKIASTTLNIALTTRNKHNGEDVPMCGVPYTAVDYYLAKLIKKGYKVVICDQTETPEEAKKRGGYKAVVNREITRIVTPGTITEEALLEAKANNFLMSIVPNRQNKKEDFSYVSFALIDISTDQFYTHTVKNFEIYNIITQFAPKEILISEVFSESIFIQSLKQYTEAYITFLSEAKFNPSVEQKRLENYFGLATLDGIGLKNLSEISACGSVVEYIHITQCENIPQLSYPQKLEHSKYMIIDASTSKNLELVSSYSDEKNTLLHCLDATVTAFGGRLFANRLLSPLLDIKEINARLDAIDFWIRNQEILSDIIIILKKCPDIERSLVRLKFGKINAKDLDNIRAGLRSWSELKKSFKEIADFVFENKCSLNKLFDFSKILNTLNASLEEVIPISNQEGRIIKPGFSAELDTARQLLSDSHFLMNQLQQKYSMQLGISTLKIKNNSIWGWYIEIPSSQKNKMTEMFLHKQTLVNCVRYVTNELLELQEKIDKASIEVTKIENDILSKIISQIINMDKAIIQLVEFLAILDISTSMAMLAISRNYCRPEIVDRPILDIKNGRHPVLELLVSDFISNDCILDEDSKLSLLTGPNMAGKSTYLRQNAIIILMAQIGLYIPATSAKIGISDRLFSRIGASDDLAKGRSTFMVEMIETATILNLATEKSFVILDEVGRGTSTYDGLSIAWAVVEYLYNINKSRVIFATHYMELTSIKNQYNNLKCQTLKVKEWQDKVIFYHKIIDGITDKSYGIYVAQLAGLPKLVIQRAKSLLKLFEKNDINSPQRRQLSIFDTPKEEATQAKSASDNLDSIIKVLEEIDPDDLSPKMALQIVYKLKKMI